MVEDKRFTIPKNDSVSFQLLHITIGEPNNKELFHICLLGLWSLLLEQVLYIYALYIMAYLFSNNLGRSPGHGLPPSSIIRITNFTLLSFNFGNTQRITSSTPQKATSLPCHNSLMQSKACVFPAKQYRSTVCP